MKSIQISSWGQPPTFTPSAPTPPNPSPESGEIQLRILASGLHRLIRSQASGTHYSARFLPLPYTPGTDGVGESPDGKRYYFVSMAKGGAFAECINVPTSALVELSPDADATQVAALVNPGLSSWMAIKARVQGLDISQPWTVVVLGVTSQSGKVAVEFARHLGATRVVGVARDEKKMASLALDDTIVLKDTVADTDFGKMGDVHVILDYLWGPPLVECLTQLNSKVPTQVVQIGTMAGLATEVPSALLRSKDVTLRGSGAGAWNMDMFRREVEGLVRAVERVGRQDVVERGLEEVQVAWGNERERTVFVPGE